MSVKKDKCFNQIKESIKGVKLDDLSWLFFILPSGKPLMIPMGSAPQGRYKNDLAFLQEACSTFSGAKDFKGKYSGSPKVFHFTHEWLTDEGRMLLTQGDDVIFS